MNSQPDPEDYPLRTAFARLRAEENAAAPIWKALPCCANRSRRVPHWTWPALGAVTCTLVALVWMIRPRPTTDLSTLPAFLPNLSTSSTFLEVETSDLVGLTSPSPSDFLLPTTLTIRIL